MDMDKARILICDDDRGVRDAMRLILSRETQYDVTFATNGEEAVRFAKKNDFDLLISDVKMPRMDGLEAVGKVKRLRPRIRILVITGYESRDVAAQAVHLKVDDYLTKPFERAKFLGKIRELLSLKR